MHQYRTALISKTIHNLRFVIKTGMLELCLMRVMNVNWSRR